jgi:hypothetical protein
MKIDFSTVLTSVISAIVTAVSVIGASTLGYFNRDRELDIRMVDVALTILSAKDEGTKSLHAKRYALQLLSNYGGVEISDGDQIAWAADGNVFVGNWPSIKGATFGKEFFSPGALTAGVLMKEPARMSPEFEESLQRLLNDELNKRFSGKGVINPE